MPSFVSANPLPIADFAVEETPITQTVPYLTLAWEIPEVENPERAFGFEVEVANSPDFLDATTYYRGRDRSSFISGLDEGDYFYRVRTFTDAGLVSA